MKTVIFGVQTIVLYIHRGCGVISEKPFRYDSVQVQILVTCDSSLNPKWPVSFYTNVIASNVASANSYKKGQYCEYLTRSHVATP